MFLETILHFNISALFIFAMTIFYIIYRKSYKAYSSFCFLILNLVYFVVCVLDILVSCGRLPLLAEKIGMFFYYSLKYLASIIFLYYLVTITDSKDVISSKRKGFLYSIPFIITMAFLISNLFTGHIYYFEDGVYYRGKYIFVFYSLTFIYVIIGLIWVIRFIKAFRVNEIFAILSVYVLSISALIIQFFNPEVLIELLASSISFILLSITIERSQLILDPRTGLKNNYNFDKKLFITFKRKKEKGLIIFYIKNYMILFNKYNYDVAVKNIRAMTTYLTKAYLSNVDYECFYLGDGVIALMTDNLEDADKLSGLMSDTILNPLSDTRKFEIDYLLCIASIPDDFNSIESIYEFKKEFVDSVEYDNKIIRISDLKEDKDFNIALNIEEIVDNAIKNDNLYVEFQPVYNMKKKKFTVLESYVKIKDDKYGILNAEDFIICAEKKNKIYDIDIKVIEYAYKTYIDFNLESLGIEHIAINISVKTLLNSSFLHDLDIIESKYKLKEDVICFEVKEREKNTFIQEAFVTINNLMKDGYLFSLDKYGIGCMPIVNLAKVPFLNVKFDKSFAKICYKEETSKVIKTTIKLLNELNKSSVCTGVETEEEAKIIEALNPDYVQGYYYSNLLKASKLVEFLNGEGD